MRLIDADALEPDAGWDEYDDAFTTYSRFQIEDAPTIKPEQKHGYWMNTDETIWDAKEIDGKQKVEISIVAAQCSSCKCWAEQVNNFPPYMHYGFCPNCGATMDAKQPKNKKEAET